MLSSTSASTSSSVAQRSKRGGTAGPAARLGCGADVQVDLVLEHGCLMVGLGAAGRAAEAQRLLNAPRSLLHQVLAQQVVRRPHLLPAQGCASIYPPLLAQPKSTVQLTSASAQRDC